MVKAIIFDFFGVIWGAPFESWLRHHGYKREGGYQLAAQQADMGQTNMSQFFEYLSALSGQPADEIKREFDTVERIDYEAIKLIVVLKANYKIGIISNASSDFIRKILRRNDLEKYFDDIVVSGEVGIIKPNKQIYEIALNRLQLNPSEAVFIDDNKFCIDGAEVVGMTGVLFESAAQAERKLRELDVKL